MNHKTYTFHIQGMHCNACALLIESELNNYPGIVHAKVSSNTHSVEVIGDFNEKTDIEIATMLTVPIEDNGYTLSTRKLAKKRNWSEFTIAVPIALGFITLFIVLQKIGLVNLVGGGDVTYGTAFVIGIIASFSSCMAVVGGLLLSMSATFAKEGDLTSGKGWSLNNIQPQLMFHGGRIASFFILGGAIGALGTVFTLSTTATFALSLIIGIVMLVLGINLLDVFPWAKKLQPSMPKFIATRAYSVSRLNHTITPLLVGVATFFLPCGFTQSMQLYTLTTGSFLKGGLTMLVFALGTLPVLALISFSSSSIQGSKKAGIFFKSAGLIVILFALFNIISSLVVVGVIPPIFNF